MSLDKCAGDIFERLPHYFMIGFGLLQDNSNKFVTEPADGVLRSSQCHFGWRPPQFPFDTLKLFPKRAVKRWETELNTCNRGRTFY